MNEKTGADEFRNIAEFLDETTFRRSLFGVKQEDVFACMQDLNAMYQDCLQDWKTSNPGQGSQNYEELVKNLTEIREEQKEIEQEHIRQLSVRDKQIESLTEYTEKYKTVEEQYLIDKEENWKQIQMLQEESQKKEVQIKELQEKEKNWLEEKNQLLQQLQDSTSTFQDQENGAEEFAETSERLARLMIETQRMSDKQLEEAKRQAKRILAEAKAEAIQISEENAERERQKEEEAQKSLSHLEHFKADVVKNLKLIRSEIGLLGNEAADLEERILDMPKLTSQLEIAGTDVATTEELQEERRRGLYGIAQ